MTGAPLELILIAGVLCSKFDRTADDLYSAAPGQLPNRFQARGFAQKFNDDSADLNHVRVWACASFRGNYLLHSAIMWLVSRV